MIDRHKHRLASIGTDWYIGCMTAQQRLARHQPVRVRFTADEFMELAQHPPLNEWQGKIELVEGMIVRMSPAFKAHWNAQRLLNLELVAAFAAAGPSWVVGVEAAVKLGKLTVRIPDIAVLRDPELTGTMFDRAELFLAVEIADTTLRNDLGRKLRSYAASGVPHYWVVDVNGRAVHIMSDPEGNDYRTRQEARFGTAIDVPGAATAIILT